MILSQRVQERSIQNMQAELFLMGKKLVMLALKDRLKLTNKELKELPRLMESLNNELKLMHEENIKRKRKNKDWV